MRKFHFEGKTCHLPGGLSEFQLQLYVHLIKWKWENLSLEPAIRGGVVYDAIMPESLSNDLQPLYRQIKERFVEHQAKFPFKSHLFLGHMASSQAACANLFLPILENPETAAKVLRVAKPDLNSIATDQLDRGFRLDFWDEPENLLNDHTFVSGTDADIAIAYYNKEGELNLWMIEHKLTEKGFTQCRAARSKGRTARHRCSPTVAVMADPDLCYYHSAKRFRYWDLTLQADSPFDLDHLRLIDTCPFMGGVNQLWRNQLLAYGLEKSSSASWPYKKVFFSVVHHPKCSSLNRPIHDFTSQLRTKDRFFSFSTDLLINQAKTLDDPALKTWADWYEGLYYF